MRNLIGRLLLFLLVTTSCVEQVKASSDNKKTMLARVGERQHKLERHLTDNTAAALIEVQERAAPKPYGIPELHCWPWLTLDEHFVLTSLKDPLRSKWQDEVYYGKRKGPVNIGALELLRCHIAKTLNLDPDYYAVKDLEKDFQPGMRLNALVARRANLAFEHYIKTKGLFYLKAYHVATLAEAAASSPIIQTCSQQLLSSSDWRTYGELKLFRIALGLSPSGVTAFYGCHNSSIYNKPPSTLGRKHYYFDGVDCTQTDTADVYDMKISGRKRTSLQTPNVWEDFVFTHQLNLGQTLVKDDQVVFTAGAGDCVLTIWQPNTVGGGVNLITAVKDLWSLKEALRLSLRIPSEGHSDIGYLCQYHQDHMTLFLLPPALQALLPLVQEQEAQMLSSYGTDVTVLNTFKKIAGMYEDILKTHGYGTIKWNNWTNLLLSYPEYAKGSDTPWAAEFVNCYFDPPAPIKSFLKKHPVADALYQKKIRDYMYSGGSVGEKEVRKYAKGGNILEFVERVSRLWKFKENVPAVDPLLFVRMAHAAGIANPKGLTAEQASKLWQDRFGFDIREGYGLFAMQQPWEIYGYVFTTRDTVQDYDTRILKIVFEQMYTDILPLRIPECIRTPEWPRKCYLKRIIALACALDGRSVQTVQRDLDSRINAVINRLALYPYLYNRPVDIIQEHILQESAMTWQEACDACLRKALERDRAYYNIKMDPGFKTALAKRVDETRLNAKYVEAFMKWFLTSPPDANNLEQAHEAFQAMLQGRHEEYMQLGYFTEEICHHMVYREEIEREPRIEVFRQALGEQTSPWLNKFKELNTWSPLLNSALTQGYSFFDLRTIMLAEHKGPMDRDAFEKDVRSRYCRDLPAVQKLHLPPAMIDQVVDDLTSDDSIKFHLAIQKHVPALYRALLGGRAHEDESLYVGVAQELAKGLAFGQCHGLDIPLSEAGWLQVALRFMDIQLSAYQVTEELYNPSTIRKFAEHLAKGIVDDKTLWAMHPIEVGCRFRQANSFYTNEFHKNRIQHVEQSSAMRKDKQLFIEQVLAARRAVSCVLQKTDPYWQLDGRNPKYHDAFVAAVVCQKQTLFRFTYDMTRCYCLVDEQLRCDPYLKQPLIEQLVPQPISDNQYALMQRSLSELAREFLGDVEDQRKAIYNISRFFRIAILDPKEFLTDNPTPPDPFLRKRVFLVYNKVFDPLLGAGMRAEAYHELETIIRNCDSCIDAARRTLLLMEKHRNVCSIGEAPTLFEKLALVLKNFRSEVLTDTAISCAKRKGRDDPVEYDLFMRNAFGIAVSTDIEACPQMYLQFIQYKIEDVSMDARFFIEKYREGMLKAVFKAIRYGSKPNVGADPTQIYISDIADWASDLSPKYANSCELDAELINGGQIRATAVLDLLEDAGYLERAK